MDLPSCPSCRQSVLDDDAEVCPFCGAPMKGGAPAPGSRASSKPAPKPAAAPSRPPARPDHKSTPSASAKSAAPASTPAAPKSAKSPAATPGPTARSAARPTKPAAKSKALSEDDLFGDDLEFDSPSSPPPSSAASVEDEGDDPLEVKSSAGKDAIAASAQRTKSRPQKVTCPMCETVGYVPTSAAGKQVRCANPKCLVPVFVAPRLQKKVEEVKSKKSGSPTMLLLIVGLLIALVAGGGFWLYNRPAPLPEPAKGPTQFKFRTPTDAGTEGTKPAQPTEDQGGKTQAPPEAQLTLAEERDPVFEIMQRDAANPERNLRPTYCQRIVAQTAADCGKLDIAQKSIDLLAKGQRDQAFYRIAPLTSMAWQQLKQGDQTAAGKSLDEAMKATAELPTMGRDSLDFSSALAAALVAVGRDQEAKALVARYPANGSNGRLVALMTTAAVWNTFDTVAAENERPLLDLPSLQCPLVVEIAVARGYPAQALRFAESLTDPSERAQTLIAWGEAVARAQARAKSTDLSSIDPVAAKLEPANRARLQARLGSVRLRADDRSGAEKWLATAIASLGAMPPPKEFVIPSVKKLATFSLHDPSQARINALALAEIARLEGALDKRADAQKHLDLAVAVLRASAPNKIAARQVIEDAGLLKYTEFEEAAPTKGRKDAIALIKRRNQERAKAALEKVRKTSKVLSAAADARFELQTQILASALAWDDAAHIWQIIGPHATAAEPDQKEPYFETGIPLQLAYKLRGSGDKATADQILQAQGSIEPPTETVIDLLARKAVESDDGLAREMQRLWKDGSQKTKLERADLERPALAASNYLLQAGKVARAIEFARMFDDSQLKEEALEWTAALACRLNHTRETNDLLHAASFIPTEAVSAYRGFLIGLIARESGSEATSPPSATEKVPPTGTK